jgi:hypothetical protein
MQAERPDKLVELRGENRCHKRFAHSTFDQLVQEIKWRYLVLAAFVVRLSVLCIRLILGLHGEGRGCCSRRDRYGGELQLSRRDHV